MDRCAWVAMKCGGIQRQGSESRPLNQNSRVWGIKVSTEFACPLTWSCVYAWPGVQRLLEKLWSVLGELGVWVLTNRPDQQASKCSLAAAPHLLWSKENVATTIYFTPSRFDGNTSCGQPNPNLEAPKVALENTNSV